METSSIHDRVSPEALRLGYEPQRIRVRAFLVFLVLFAAAMLAIQAMLLWMMHRIEAHEDRMDMPRSAVAQTPQPPAPNLQPSFHHDMTDAQDLEELRTQEDQLFTKLGWRVDPASHQAEFPDQIVEQVAAGERARAARGHVPPTDTGRNTNTILPTSRASQQPDIGGGATQ